MTRGGLETYRGNYSHYVQQRADRMAAHRTLWEAQQAHIAETEAYIRRYKAGQRSKQARGRQTRLERFKRDELIERPYEHQTIHLGLTTDVRSGDIVLRTKDLVIGYEVRSERVLETGAAAWAGGPPINRPARRQYRVEHALFTVPDLEIRRGQCVALIGPNGSGKTTLLKTIIGEVPPLAGSVRPGASVILGYLAQASAALRPDQTVLDAILEVENLPIGQARNFLGRFLQRRRCLQTDRDAERRTAQPRRPGPPDVGRRQFSAAGRSPPTTSTWRHRRSCRTCSTVFPAPCCWSATTVTWSMPWPISFG